MLDLLEGVIHLCAAEPPLQADVVLAYARTHAADGTKLGRRENLQPDRHRRLGWWRRMPARSGTS